MLNYYSHHERPCGMERFSGMRCTGYLIWALLVAGSLWGGPAFANVCQADNANVTCPTGMPVGGFCQCTAHGTTQDGTVVSKPEPHRSTKAATGGCGAQ